jgi:hypothetical protein
VLPTFLVVGAPKAGTSSLHRYVGEHPDVFVPQLKEPCYFGLDDGTPARFCGPGDDREVNAKTVSNRADYEALYDGARPEQARGDFSTQHLGMVGSAARAAAVVPDARIIAVLREPAGRAASHWAMKVGLGHETLGFAEALDAEAERLDAGYAPCWGYRRAGCYADQLTAWIDAFGRERVKVALYDDFERDPAAFTAEVFEFLGLDATVRVDTAQRYNRTRTTRRTWVQSAVRHRGSIRVARAVLPRSARHRLLDRVDATTRPKADPDTVRELRDWYGPERQRLEALVGIDLRAWA